jgi:Ca-activated chloride channel family protein
MNATRQIWLVARASLLAVAFAACDSRSSSTAQQSAGGNPPTPEPAQAEAKGEASLTRNFYFVFDGSGSMAQACGGDRVSKIVGAKQALTQFMAVVPTNCNLGLYVFDARGVREAVPLGPDNRGQFLDAVASIRPANGTPLGEAIEFAVRRLAAQRDKQLGYGDFRLVVVTDGEANGRVPLSQATRFAQSNGIPIYTIGLCIGHDHALRKSSVSYRGANSIADLQKGLEETLGETAVFDAATFDETKSKP